MGRRRRVPRYCRHKGTGQGYATDPRTGLEVYFGAHGEPASYQRYMAWVADFLSDSLPGAPAPAPGALTVAGVLALYVEHADRTFRRADGQPTSQAHNARQVARWVNDVWGDLAASAFGSPHLKRVRQAMVDHGLARSSVNNLIAHARRAWQWAATEGLVPDAAASALHNLAGLRHGQGGRETANVQPADPQHVRAVLAVLPARWQPVLLVQWHSGMRPGEAVSLRVQEIDRAQMPWLYAPPHHKTTHKGKGRRIYFGPKARDVLAPLLRGRPPTAWVFPGRFAGSHLAASSYWGAVRDACDAAGVPRWHPHQLRHRAGTDIRKQYGLEGTQAALGHESRQTSERYSEPDDDLAKRIAEEMG